MSIELSQEAKATAMTLAMYLELGQADMTDILNYIRDKKDLFTPVLEFWEKASPMTQDLVTRLALESRYLRS